MQIQKFSFSGSFASKLAAVSAKILQKLHFSLCNTKLVINKKSLECFINGVYVICRRAEILPRNVAEHRKSPVRSSAVSLSSFALLDDFSPLVARHIRFDKLTNLCWWLNSVFSVRPSMRGILNVDGEIMCGECFGSFRFSPKIYSTNKLWWLWFTNRIKWTLMSQRHQLRDDALNCYSGLCMFGWLLIAWCEHYEWMGGRDIYRFDLLIESPNSVQPQTSYNCHLRAKSHENLKTIKRLRPFSRQHDESK